MSEYEETEKRPRGMFDDYFSEILELRNNGFTCERVARYLKDVYGVKFKTTAVQQFCGKALQVKRCHVTRTYNPDDKMVWNIGGLSFLEHTA